MGDETEMRILDFRLQKVEETMMELKDSAAKTAECLQQLVVLSARHEENREAQDRELVKLDELQKAVTEIKLDIEPLKMMKKGVFGIGMAIVLAAIGLVWTSVTGGSF